MVSNMAFIFHNIWDNPSHWLSYFSEGFKPPTSIDTIDTWILLLTDPLHMICKLILGFAPCPLIHQKYGESTGTILESKFQVGEKKRNRMIEWYNRHRHNSPNQQPHVICSNIYGDTTSKELSRNPTCPWSERSIPTKPQATSIASRPDVL